MKLTKKQKEFADEFLETGNKTQSALKTYNTTDYKTASVIGSENLDKPSIIKYIQSRSSMAISNIEKLANNAKNETVRLNANKDILDRGGMKVVDNPLENARDITFNIINYGDSS